MEEDRQVTLVIIPSLISVHERLSMINTTTTIIITILFMPYIYLLNPLYGQNKGNDLDKLVLNNPHPSLITKTGQIISKIAIELKQEEHKSKRLAKVSSTWNPNKFDPLSIYKKDSNDREIKPITDALQETYKSILVQKFYKLNFIKKLQVGLEFQLTPTLSSENKKSLKPVLYTIESINYSGISHYSAKDLPLNDRSHRYMVIPVYESKNMDIVTHPYHDQINNRDKNVMTKQSSLTKLMNIEVHILPILTKNNINIKTLFIQEDKIYSVSTTTSDNDLYLTADLKILDNLKFKYLKMGSLSHQSKLNYFNDIFGTLALSFNHLKNTSHTTYGYRRKNEYYSVTTNFDSKSRFGGIQYVYGLSW